MNDNFFGTLGLCRRSGNLSWGRETAKQSVRSHKAKLILIASDISERIKREFKILSEEESVEIVFLEETMQTLAKSVGVNAGVFTVNDEGFAKLLKKNSR